MAPKKRILQVQPFDDIVVVGISTTLSDYKLTWHLNDALCLELKKMTGFSPEDQTSEPHSFYYYDAGENANIFSLLQFIRNGRKLLALPIPVDYLMIVRNGLKPDNLARILSAIRSIRNVLAAWPIDLSKTKGLDPLLEAIEFHEMGLKRQSLPRSIRPGLKSRY